MCVVCCEVLLVPEYLLFTEQPNHVKPQREERRTIFFQQIFQDIGFLQVTSTYVVMTSDLCDNKERGNKEIGSQHYR